jgi:prepilin-type N-terminal cleavage/methylation domain-containing protein
MVDDTRRRGVALGDRRVVWRILALAEDGSSSRARGGPERAKRGCDHSRREYTAKGVTSVRSRLRALHREEGFTLIELLVVVAIIGLIVAIAIPRVVAALDNARLGSAEAQAKQIQVAFARYNADCDGTYPSQSGNSLGGPAQNYTTDPSPNGSGTKCGAAATTQPSITGYDDLRNVLYPYVALPPTEGSAEFSFSNYTSSTNPPYTYTLVIKARNNAQSTITITPDEITTSP